MATYRTSSRRMPAEYAGRYMGTKQEKDPGRVSKESHLWTKPKTRHADVGEMLARAGRCFVASDWRARPSKLCSLFGEVTMTLRASETSKVHSAYGFVQLLPSECCSQCQRCPLSDRCAWRYGAWWFGQWTKPPRRAPPQARLSLSAQTQTLALGRYRLGELKIRSPQNAEEMKWYSDMQRTLCVMYHVSKTFSCMYVCMYN